MNRSVQPSLASLYEEDETAWLEQMAELVASGRWDEVDRENLTEFLTSMARRDKREVLHRLQVLLAHLLKWEYQPDKRSKSWRNTIRSQRDELASLLKSGSLRKHAAEVFADAYRHAVELAMAETVLLEDVFPSESPWSLDEALEQELS